MALEIERRFLLKSLPYPLEFDMRYYIGQFYIPDGDKTIRYRKATQTDKKSEYNGDFLKKFKYYKTTKTPISLGVFEELEEEINHKTFVDAIETSKSVARFITKDRYVIKDSEQNLKFEIDSFIGCNLTIVEVELNDINQSFTLPDCLKDLVIIEITGQKDFSNYSLSFPFNYNLIPYL